MGFDGNGSKVVSKFNPNKVVTRAQFATIFSRLLFDDRYNGRTPYYVGHIAGLKTHGIIKDVPNPQMKERVGYDMLMMMRADKAEIGNAAYHAAPAEN